MCGHIPALTTLFPHGHLFGNRFIFVFMDRRSFLNFHDSLSKNINYKQRPQIARITMYENQYSALSEDKITRVEGVDAGQVDGEGGAVIVDVGDRAIIGDGEIAYPRKS